LVRVYVHPPRLLLSSGIFSNRFPSPSRCALLFAREHKGLRVWSRSHTFPPGKCLFRPSYEFLYWLRPGFWLVSPPKRKRFVVVLAVTEFLFNPSFVPWFFPQPEVFWAPPRAAFFSGSIFFYFSRFQPEGSSPRPVAFPPTPLPLRPFFCCEPSPFAFMSRYTQCKCFWLFFSALVLRGSASFLVVFFPPWTFPAPPSVALSILARFPRW